MLKFSLFKKRKEVNLEDLCGRDVFYPEHDWRRIISIFFFWILVVIAVSLYTFMKVVKEDVSVRHNHEDYQVAETINTSRLKAAAQFVRSRLSN